MIISINLPLTSLNNLGSTPSAGSTTGSITSSIIIGVNNEPVRLEIDVKINRKNTAIN